MQFSAATFGLPVSSAPAPQMVPPEEGEPLSSDGDEEPRDRCVRLVKEITSLEYKKLNIPKNPACEICQRNPPPPKVLRRFIGHA